MEGQQVIEKILADARAEAEKIKKQAEEKETTEQVKLNEQLTGYEKQTVALAQKTANTKKMQLFSAARMEIAKKLLTEKRKILDEVFEQARRQTQNLPDEKYRELITKLMLEVVETGDAEIVIDKNENRINQELIEQINQQLGPGYKGNLRLSDERQDLGGGFILRRGKIKTNVSFEVLFDQARKELEIELAKELFEG